jgi:16S rRNA C1402 (ribose-2'-O) methylase RsmI
MLRGEFVIVLEATSGADAARQLAGEEPQSLADAREAVARLVAAGAKRSEAARRIAAATGLDRHELYRPD